MALGVTGSSPAGHLFLVMNKASKNLTFSKNYSIIIIEKVEKAIKCACSLDGKASDF